MIIELFSDEKEWQLPILSHKSALVRRIIFRVGIFVNGLICFVCTKLINNCQLKESEREIRRGHKYQQTLGQLKSPAASSTVLF